MTLNDLYPRGTKLADVPPLLQGMPLREWLSLQLQAQAEAYRASGGVPDGAPGTKWRGKKGEERCDAINVRQTSQMSF